jgi:hypothetical protein
MLVTSGAGYESSLESEASQPKEAGALRRFAFEPLWTLQPTLEGEWRIKGLLPSHGLAALYGPPGCGKSFVALDACLHVAAGLSWSGRKVKQAPVVYLAAEGGTGVRNRATAAVRERRIPSDTQFHLITTPPNLGTADGDAALLIREIREQAAALGIQPGIVVLDTLARSIPGADESSARDMGVFVQNRIGSSVSSAASLSSCTTAARMPSAECAVHRPSTGLPIASGKSRATRAALVRSVSPR